jgi:actin-like ATPase involved in cell morphogenesis
MSETPQEYAEPVTDQVIEEVHHSFERAEPETTGDETVDEVVASLRGLDDLPVAEHVALFERAHESLRQVLNSAGEPVQASQA